MVPIFKIIATLMGIHPKLLRLPTCVAEGLLGGRGLPPLFPQKIKQI